MCVEDCESELDGAACTKHRLCGCQVDAIEAAQPVHASEISALRTSGSSTVTICQSGQYSSSAQGNRTVRARVTFAVGKSRNGRARLGICDDVCRDAYARRNSVSDKTRVGFVDKKLDQRGGVAIQDHRSPRCSLTISASVCSPASTRKIGFGTPGFPTLPGRTHGWLRRNWSASSLADRLLWRAFNGSNRGTGLPRDVTVISWPSCSLRRYSDKRLFSSRTDTSMIDSSGDFPPAL